MEKRVAMEAVSMMSQWSQILRFLFSLSSRYHYVFHTGYLWPEVNNVIIIAFFDLIFNKIPHLWVPVITGRLYFLHNLCFHDLQAGGDQRKP